MEELIKLGEEKEEERDGEEGSNLTGTVKLHFITWHYVKTVSYT